MPIPTGSPPPRGCAAGAVSPGSGAGALSLPVLTAKPPKRALAKSKMGKWRALVLILVQLAIAGHIVMWVATGMRSTLSPVEPSEAMYTLEQGLVNAGFVFFALAILSVFVLGRFFCGWGCHVVALQDLCTWAMEKMGVRPKPFRSRLLVWAPLGLALYMFVWPTFNREVFKPAMVGLGWWDAVAPFVRDVPPPVFRGGAGQNVATFFKPAFVKTNFWETFAAWYVAIPFLIVCGFAAVYFLGNKGFCTYGCPYGGFFGPADMLAPGRIRVTDACEHCGHCTAACTSNVRVHEEVRDYGMVVDPGCMKCMDCISVCPTDALYFGFGTPAAFAKKRAGAAPTKRFKSRVYDLSLAEELAAGALFIFLFIAYIKLAYWIPLLMAMGMAGIGTFLAWKTWRLVREPSVRVQNLQLKLKGRLKPAGVAMAAMAAAMLALAGWSAAVKIAKLRAKMIDQRLTLPFERVFDAAYHPDAADKAKAERALSLYRFAAAPKDGGIGWADIELLRRMAWMSAVAGDPEGARKSLTRGIELAGGHEVDVDDLLNALVQVSAMRRRTPQDFAADLRAILAESPEAPVRVVLAGLLLQLGDAPGAIQEATRAAADRPRDTRTASQASRVLIQAGKAGDGASILEPHILRKPRDGGLRADYAVALANAERLDEALEQARYAAELDTANPGIPALAAEILHQLGRHDEAAVMETQAKERQNRLRDTPAAAPARPVTDSGTR